MRLSARRRMRPPTVDPEPASAYESGHGSCTRRERFSFHQRSAMVWFFCWSRGLLSIACMHLSRTLLFPQNQVVAHQKTPGISWNALLARAEQVLAFLDDLRIPLRTNQAERDLRLINMPQQMSGTFRSTEGARALCVPRSSLSTMRTQGRFLLAA